MLKIGLVGVLDPKTPGFWDFGFVGFWVSRVVESKSMIVGLLAEPASWEQWAASAGITEWSPVMT